MATTAARETARVVDAGTYRVTIGAGLRHELGNLVAAAARAHHYAIVTDDGVAPHYAPAAQADLKRHGRTSVHRMPAGETHKTRDTWIRLTDDLLAAGCGRDTTVVALGGGVVGDVAGFVAATFMRGVPVVQCPTSLLAMIDASVGGKTGVDTAAGKNLVGAFHPPSAVLVDVDTLRTLPDAHRRAGLAEAIKHGAIADATYFTRVETLLPAVLAADAPATIELVARSVEIKAAVVRADERESGLRKTLNFGHTLGHALEQASGYALLHGEAVAIGMVLEARLAERLGVAERGTAAEIERVVRIAGLPSAVPGNLSPAAILDATRHDKKARAGAVAFALPAGIGTMAGAERDWAIEVGDALVLEVLS
ncbi:MAG: 3-dehydroquinate synthase [Gemmatimonadaceae bacterium]|nr:3-dehydroquinate synthase [Gemmatimonadaceae bacterium]NUP70321.1 3-dehydroquinate synthase [Gemmatimonadaceae bacterium]NUR34237.1 3-dehydroquinate synthase [Gemmatimonadaceae bacterium]